MSPTGEGNGEGEPGGKPGAQRGVLAVWLPGSSRQPHDQAHRRCRQKGYFCPTPTIVKSAQELVILFLQHLAPVLRIAVVRRQRVEIYHGRSGTEFDGPEQSDVLPGYRRNATEKVARLPTLPTHISSPPRSCQDKV